MASLSLHMAQTKDDGGTMKEEPSSLLAHHSGFVVVASFGDRVAADYVADATQQPPTLSPDRGGEGRVRGERLAELSQRDAIVKLRAGLDRSRLEDIVLFLPPRLGADERSALDALLALAKEHQTNFIGIVSTFRVHLGDKAAAQAERYVFDQLKGMQTRLAIFRPAHILSEQSTARINLRRFSFLAPLVPGRYRSCCVAGHELFAAINDARQGSRRRCIYALLGPNRPWKERLREHRGHGVVQTVLAVACFLVALLLVGHFAAIVLDLLARWRPSLRHWNFDTLHPRSFQELLALYNPHNFQYVKVVGYNNGVVHFGHRFPGKTVVSTVLCNRVSCPSSAWARGKGFRHAAGGMGKRPDSIIKADCGTTIRKAMDLLADAGQELYVLPNYSYVCLGTAFFVPIHGSASDYATIAETMTRVLLYDPVSDRFLRASSDEPAFREHVYNMRSNILLLRVCLRVKPKARYFVHREELNYATAEGLLNALRDPGAANVEIRKSKASSSTVELSKYYQAAHEGEPSLVRGQVDLLEIPRDSLGRLWDRLEENAITSFLMHALTRWFAWHVELFFSAEEFKTFWHTHQSLPLRKIQLRHIRRDGLPHSPFCEHDCVSVDMFMFRWRRQAFEAYVKQTFAVVRSNPGKHSQ
jgi:hypothetical protein